MPDGQIITVKKLADNSPIARDKAFANEVQNIMALHHENVLKLVGYCHEGQKKVVLNNGRYIVADIVESLLCHEYVPRGSLQKNLFGKYTKTGMKRYRSRVLRPPQGWRARPPALLSPRGPP